MTPELLLVINVVFTFSLFFATGFIVRKSVDYIFRVD